MVLKLEDSEGVRLAYKRLSLGQEEERKFTEFEKLLPQKYTQEYEANNDEVSSLSRQTCISKDWIVWYSNSSHKLLLLNNGPSSPSNPVSLLEIDLEVLKLAKDESGHNIAVLCPESANVVAVFGVLQEKHLS